MKALFKALFVLLVVVGIAVGVALGHLGRVVKTGVEETGPMITGSPVALQQADISIFSGAGVLDQLKVSNPEGFSEPYAFDLNKIDLQVDVSSVLDEVVVIEKLHIDGAKLVAELSQDGRNNLKMILDHARSLAAKSASGSPASGEESEADTQASEPTKFVIKSFKFTGAELKAIAPSLNVNKVLQVRDIELTDIGTAENPLDSAQLVEGLLEPIVEEVSKQVRDDFANSQLEKIKNKLGDTLNNLFH